MNDFNLKAQKDYVSGGRSIAKLDVAIESMVQQKDEFIVSVKFINSGDYPMITGSPDNWSGIWGGNLLWINGESSDGKNKLNVDLSGLPLLNKSDFPDEFVTIPSRSTVTYKFAVKPTDKIKAGTYSLETRVFMSVGANDGPVATMGKVDFHSDRSKPTHIIIDRDYPSTPEEWKDFDARKAKEVSSLLPGTTVTVPGYYRAISVFGPRAQFVTELKAGKPAPPLDINHWDKWEWETDLARTTICEAGDICPRDGRWVVRTVGQRLGDERVTHSQHERRLRTGDVMPTLAAETGIGRHYRWEWLGLS